MTAEHEGGNSDPTGSAGFRGHPNTPSIGAAKPPPSSSAKFELIEDGDSAVSNSNIVVLSKANSGAFQHRGSKLVSSLAK